MRTHILFACLTVVMLSCKDISEPEQLELKEVQVAEDNMVNEKLQPNTTLQYFPEESAEIINDTLVNGYSISIARNISGDYQEMVFEIDGETAIHRFRDFTFRLIVEKEHKVVIDTLFKKQNFLDFTGEQFIDKAVFDYYSFQSMNDTEMIFSGYLGKPETDWVFNFNHYYNLERQEFQIEEQVYEGEF